MTLHTVLRMENWLLMGGKYGIGMLKEAAETL